METQSIMFWGATTLYALATGMFFTATVFKRDWGQTIGYILACTAIMPHAAAIVLRWREVGHGPYNSQYEVISANALVLVCCYLIAALVSPRLKGIGLFIAPAVFLMMGLAVSTFGVKAEVPIIFKSYWLFLHIGFAKAFAATNVIAGGCAVAYLIKERNPGSLPALPDRPMLELYAAQFLMISFLFLGVMIIAGSLWAHQSWGRYWAWDPIETSSLVTWIVIGIILHLRSLHGWNGRSFACLTILALACGILTLYVVTLVVPTIHNSYLVGE